MKKEEGLMKALKSGPNWRIYLLVLPVIVGLWACASSSSDPKTQLDEPTFSISGTWEIYRLFPQWEKPNLQSKSLKMKKN